MQTVIAAFDDPETARRAADRLIEQGYPRSSVHVEAGRAATTGTTTSTTDTYTEHDRGLLERIEDFFSNLFGSDSTEDAGTYAEAVRRGSTIVAVDANSDAEVEKATALMRELGSVDIDERASQWRSEGWTGTARDIGSEGRDVRGTEGETVMPVVREELQVGKRTIEGGGVRVVQRVAETPVSELVRLREERATIERRPADRPATEADLANFKEGTVEVRERSEEAVVSKTARVVEEVVVGKEVSEREEAVSDTVRQTDVEVERLDAGAAATSGRARRTATTASTTGTATGTTTAGNDDQARGIAKQREGEARDSAGSAAGSLGEKIAGKSEKVAGKVQEGYGNLKEDVTRRKS